MYTSSQRSQKSDGDGSQGSPIAGGEIDKDFAWLTSHVHTYVLPFGGRQGSVDPFCTTCRERKEASIVALFEGKEKLWIDSFELFVEVQLSIATRDSVSKNVKSKWHGAKAQLGGGWNAVVAAGLKSKKGPETLENVDLGYPSLSERMIHQVNTGLLIHSLLLSHILTYSFMYLHTHPLIPFHVSSNAPSYAFTHSHIPAHLNPHVPSLTYPL